MLYIKANKSIVKPTCLNIQYLQKCLLRFLLSSILTSTLHKEPAITVSHHNCQGLLQNPFSKSSQSIPSLVAHPLQNTFQCKAFKNRKIRACTSFCDARLIDHVMQITKEAQTAKSGRKIRPAQRAEFSEHTHKTFNRDNVL